MANNKDFFGEEYDKQQSHQEQNQSNLDRQFNDWQQATPPSNGDGNTKKAKAITITLIALSLVVVFVLGFVCAVFFNKNTTDTDVFSQVLQTIKDKYYVELTEEELQAAIEAGGSAMMKSLDQYSTLYSPQSAYDFLYSNNDIVYIEGEIFGFGLSLYSGVGLLVASIQTDSAVYGRMQVGDIILKINNPLDKGGNPCTNMSGEVVTSINMSTIDMTTLNYYLASVYSGEFVYLREGELHSVQLKRQEILDHSNGYSYVEYYVNTGEVQCNVSTVGEYSTEKLRGLDQLATGIGYVRLKQFDYVANDQNQILKSSAQELKKVLEKFKSLGVKNIILDLKGNPGGYVSECAEIAGMLAHTGNMTGKQISQNGLINNNNQMFVSVLKGRENKILQTFYATSTYNNYFDDDNKIHIAVFTDSGSASCSEMLLGVLLDYGTAVHFGSTSYGKGITQSAELLPITGTVTKNDGTKGTFNWMIYYTNARYYSPLGTNIHGVGYTPVKERTSNNYIELIQMVNEYFGK